MVIAFVNALFVAALFSALTGKCKNSKMGGPDLFNFSIRKIADPRKIIQGFGYPAEAHKIVTEDGYVLVLHRIPRGKKKAPVLIMHGIGSSSADFVNMGPKVSLGYVLADKGYDVWIGNARGNSYSNRNVYVNPKLHPEKFYNFSWHEIGTIDLPAKIDYVLNVTKQKKIYYIGHSQGGTIFYVMASIKPEYNDKIRLASLMAPAGLVNNVPEPLIKFLSQYINRIQSVLELLHIYHIPALDLIRSFLQNLCKYDRYFALCREIFYTFGGGYSDDTQLNKSVFTRIFETTPSDASSKQFLHFFQEVKSGKFQHFDYGPEGNSRNYGTLNPSEYNLTAVTAPVALYYAQNDRFVGVKDIQLITSKLPQVVKSYLVPYEKFNHGDFLFANDVKKLIYNELLRVMDVY
ncbi:lipase 3-like [Anoplophora glabripennis]|uniref:lipase 3-like n=1 Tax=Anoplophora glabripennis TaxID=217634 RepID=UPI000C76A7EE|nr:lipase 3-like [Anoplophora glabripennis]